jgi:uncharacterized membrane protein
LISPPEGAATRISRRNYLDWARGVAVLVMIQAHILDAWTLPSERSTRAFAFLNLLGGFAAPLFLWLAGLALVLAAERIRVRTGDRSEAGRILMRRGAEIFVLAFLFRVQAFIVSPGNPLVSLLRVDILNIMGPSLIGAALLWRVAAGARTAAAVCAAAAAVLALVTPVVRNSEWLTALPPVLQWYVSPAGNHSTFTVFPWAGFVFAGAAAGALLASVSDSSERRTLCWLATAGAGLALASYWASTRPSIYPASAFWTTSPTYFGIRVGVLMIAVTASFALTPLARTLPRAFAALARLGRHSLFIYWIHVELVYGYATAVLHRRLPLPLNVIAFLIFVAAMYWAIALRDHLVAWWGARARPVPSGETLSA